MARDSQTPVIVGVADIVNRSRKVEDAIEPLGLIIDAISDALEDAGSSDVRRLRSSIDSIGIVRTWTWPYEDLSDLVAQRLQMRPRNKHYPAGHGGNQPCLLLDEAARRVSQNESKVAIVAGGEALASLAACATAEKLPPPGWTKVDEEVTSVFSPTAARKMQKNLGAKHSIGAPIHVYPLLENGFRAYRAQSIQENHDESAEMYAEFAKVAETHPYSWSFGRPAQTKESIATVSIKNRMICTPYPLLMNAFNTVNLAAAVVVTSVKYAKEMGIPENKWSYVLGGAGTRDSDNFWERPNFWWSPSISRSLDAGLSISGLSKEDIDMYDFYSCFPIVPKLACHHLGLPTSGGNVPITLLGGLTSFGGAGNNYSMHAITEMSRQIRNNNGKTGLILANGGVATYQFVVCLSKSPRRDGLPYPSINPLPERITDVQVPEVVEKADGEAAIETYTVEYDRDGKPSRGHVIGRLKSDGSRFLANHADEGTLRQLCSDRIDPIGRSGTVRVANDGRNVFSFNDAAAKL